MKKSLAGVMVLSASIFAFAGGNPEYVKFPETYKSEFTNYDTRNRVNGTQVAVLYANKNAIESASGSSLDEGSTIVMEIYKQKLDDNGNGITGTDGLFEQGQLAAIAVMEKRASWDTDFESGQRSGDWGFAIYNTDGTVKNNDLDCVSCHTPLQNQDYLFSHSALLEFVKK